MRYSEQHKAEVCKLAVELDDVAEAARLRGLPRQTVHRWLSEAGVTVTGQTRSAGTEAARQRWEERRAAMQHEIGEVAAMALEATRVALAGADLRSAKDAATTMAILVDKAQLLSGGATGRVYVPPVHAERAVSDARAVGLSLVSGTD